MKNENGKSNNGASQIPAWWLEVPAAEKAVIRDVINSIRGLKNSRSGPVAMAARKWERSLACFIKFRLMHLPVRHQGKRGNLGNTASALRAAEPRHGNSPLRGEGVTIRVTSSPTSGRSQPGASPSQG